MKMPHEMDHDELSEVIRRAEADLIPMRADVARRAQQVRNLEHWLAEYRNALTELELP